jgi:plasmid maintenance system antidote protein VapI
MPSSQTATADSVRRFATDLRELRIQTGNPTLVSLAAATGVSKSVISEAFAGRRLPTQNTVSALVVALGGDREQWIARRDALDPKASEAVRTPSPAISTPARRMLPLRMVIVSMALVALASILGTSLVWNSLRPPVALAEAAGDSSAGEVVEYLDYADGVDPMQTICREDAVVAASEERLDGDVLVQMMYSNKCMAVWGRVTRYDGEAAGNSLSMLIYPAVDLESDRNQERSAVDVQSIYTTLMIEPNVEARVCGIATVSQHGDPIELGPPMCI